MEDIFIEKLKKNKRNCRKKYFKNAKIVGREVVATTFDVKI